MSEWQHMWAVCLRQALTNQQNKPIHDPWGPKPTKNWGQRPWLRTRWGHGRGHRLNDALRSADEVRAPSLATKRSSEEGSSCAFSVWRPLILYWKVLLTTSESCVQWHEVEIMNLSNESNIFRYVKISVWNVITILLRHLVCTLYLFICFFDEKYHYCPFKDLTNFVLPLCSRFY